MEVGLIVGSLFVGRWRAWFGWRFDVAGVSDLSMSYNLRLLLLDLAALLEIFFMVW